LGSTKEVLSDVPQSTPDDRARLDDLLGLCPHSRRP
jgi:hypothetical protein